MRLGVKLKLPNLSTLSKLRKSTKVGVKLLLAVNEADPLPDFVPHALGDACSYARMQFGCFRISVSHFHFAQLLYLFITCLVLLARI